ncbi:MAG TPA: pseudouridine-5'-phosphate glycosidase [Myxococcaceae bacterium]|nr:pseudouridine-5'-phosphate glycosidase [Myxococcaceae bacterium]
MRLFYGEEVQRALDRRAPLVALETSVVAQGLPPPHNLHAARACEEAVRRAGAVPAALAVIDGQVKVGLSAPELERLAAGGERVMKIGSRDLAPALAGLRTGGTTVSASMEIAARAGIRVFATGGIGGVHRGVAETLDVSQDLLALSKFPVAVVCAGAKSVLDLPKTLEALEALSVPVVGVGTHDFPSFFCRTSGLALEQRVEGPEDAARLLSIRFGELQQGGVVLALPPPADTALPSLELEKHMHAALAEADARDVRGKALTPFLLSELSRRSGGRTLKANLALLEHNAAFAGQLAVACAALSG